ncbi:hypothetical protein NPIL_24561 [Nephila pilipes]|uniref:Uncharacterized protein n=1 Tax=Nephila pilipes TaxID=299642 RepID=A0A8X6QW74_NEPPI|nr:hypothetical protein NPIL_24561 [Nephila pilipes]
MFDFHTGGIHTPILFTLETCPESFILNNKRKKPQDIYKRLPRSTVREKWSEWGKGSVTRDKALKDQFKRSTYVFKINFCCFSQLSKTQSVNEKIFKISGARVSELESL